ncbi:LTA synthase family protein [Peptostreptococcus equinus]|uniref:Sulfatase-like hydrolase/transferase n=1 Tax=Peptostreptococcus equinus TaxID=3003601 RepID=A0ABY7JQS4_9FIRM|nr:alkaline phosphatase family protein [Peptostreptococcus sp. CBA3647]WAW15499.1 sulfatase-like hydrolase/transferase [Peptostreptococcus sp. CBA3647]
MNIKVNKLNSKYKKQKFNIKETDKYRTTSFFRSSSIFEIATVSILALLGTFIVESISRFNIMDALSFIISSPLEFFVNYGIQLIFLSIGFFLIKKNLYYLIIEYLFFVLAFISRFVYENRGMPLSPFDIISFKDVIYIMGNYINKYNILILSISLIVFISIAIIFILKDKSKANIKISKIIFILLMMFLFIMQIPLIKKAGFMDKKGSDIYLNYKKNGFIYSFIDEVFKFNGQKPDNYNADEIDKLKSYYNKKENRNINKDKSLKANIIMVQIEGFIDPSQIPYVKYSEDPIPNMRKLMYKYTSGDLKVPVTGDSTLSTEFEVLTGFNSNYTGQGEIAYKTFLSKKSSLSMLRDLSEQAYVSTAINNFDRNFHNRSIVYQNMGFDRYIPIETMTNIEKDENGFYKDKMLSEYIMQEVNKTHESNDFIFAASLKGYNNYPNYYLNSGQKIKVSVESKVSDNDKNQILYYVNRLKETDQMVGELIQKINESKEPTILVFYGDHMPNLKLFYKNKSVDNLYKTKYIIANNFRENKVDVPKLIDSYQLSGYVEKIAGIKYGPINMIHNYSSNDKNYQENLKLLEYDLLFGKNYYFNQKKIEKKSNMKLGDGKLTFDDIKTVNKSYIVSGTSFNQYTNVFIDDKEVKTIYLDKNNLKIDGEIENKKVKIYLAQKDSDGNIMYKTNSKYVNFR